VQVDEDFPRLDDENEQDQGQINGLKLTMKQALTTEYKICLMHKMLLSTCHGDDVLPSDAKERARNPATDFNPDCNTPHPSSLDPSNPSTEYYNGE
jgi:hypothetical protein